MFKNYIVEKSHQKFKEIFLDISEKKFNLQKFLCAKIINDMIIDMIISERVWSCL